MEIILFHNNRVNRKAESTSYLMGQPLNIINTHTHTHIFHQLCNLLSISPAHSLTAWHTHTHTQTSVCCLPVMYYSRSITSLASPISPSRWKGRKNNQHISSPLNAGYYWLLRAGNEITSVCAVDQLDHISDGFRGSRDAFHMLVSELPYLFRSITLVCAVCQKLKRNRPAVCQSQPP